MPWRRISRFLLCLLLLSATACGEGPDGNPDDNPDDIISSTASDDTDDHHPPFEASVVIDYDVDIATALRESDAYELKIDGDHAPVIENDTLTLTISYTGGCAAHYFTLVTDGSFMESDPVQLVVILTHDDSGDTCEAYPTDRYVFDLTPIKTLYQEAYGTDEGSIILHLQHLLHLRRGEYGVLKLVYTFAP